jgi:hypothetical protein
MRPLFFFSWYLCRQNRGYKDKAYFFNSSFFFQLKKKFGSAYITVLEQVKLISQLDAEEKNMEFKSIGTFLTKQKFKDFFAKNVAML